MQKLQISTAYIIATPQCNSRCITCDYWKNKTKPLISSENILKAIQELSNHGLRKIAFSGGEALINSEEIFSVAQHVKHLYPYMQIRLLTNGILIKKYVRKIIELFDVIVISLDSANKENYHTIRGVNVFDKVVNGIKIIRQLDSNIDIRIRVVVQKNNYKELLSIINFSREMNVNEVSFIPADVISVGVFGRAYPIDNYAQIVPDINDLDELKGIISEIMRDENGYIKDGFLSKQGQDLIFVYEYYLAVNGVKDHQKRQCNAPSNATVIDSNGNILPCFFLKPIGNIQSYSYDQLLESSTLVSIQQDVDKNLYNECKYCTCPGNFK